MKEIDEETRKKDEEIRKKDIKKENAKTIVIAIIYSILIIVAIVLCLYRFFMQLGHQWWHR